jgi:3-isopropylmalate/(R)-2-methylmalate dehydratase small subunit
VVLPDDQVERLAAFATDTAEPVLAIDLERQEIAGPPGGPLRFEIDPFRRRCLLEGLDDIDLALEKAAAIDAFEERQRLSHSWLWT